jgi:hypothetical protein
MAAFSPSRASPRAALGATAVRRLNDRGVLIDVSQITPAALLQTVHDGHDCRDPVSGGELKAACIQGLFERQHADAGTGQQRGRYHRAHQPYPARTRLIGCQQRNDSEQNEVCNAHRQCIDARREVAPQVKQHDHGGSKQHHDGQAAGDARAAGKLAARGVNTVAHCFVHGKTQAASGGRSLWQAGVRPSVVRLLW